ncbi:MAG: PKD domain-containing protein, partial [Cyclobacteriaceae bacterium]|nr:PKD domain-containing protein [Cyclobacteriaceae bacterium]
IDDVIFVDGSTINSTPYPATISAWNWSFGSGEGSSGLQNPTYKYANSGLYNIKLRVTTDQGCTAIDSTQIRVGPVPIVNFYWSNVCNGDSTTFTDLTNPGISNVVSYTWDFGDGENITGPTGVAIPAGTHSNRTNGIYNDPYHTYVNYSPYTVNLTVTTDDNCTNSASKDIFIVPFIAVKPDPSQAYFVDFEGTNGGWATATDGSSSWMHTVASGTVINDAGTGNTSWWTGQNGGSYLPQEESYVEGPCFDLTSLNRPMLSTDIWFDTQRGFDGAVIEYSVDEGLSWNTVGVKDKGINWYNEQGLISQPGAALNSANYGWSGVSGQWLNARFVLDTIPLDKRSSVRLRFGFGSDQNNPPNSSFNGFAFDNFWVGERTRVVLLENFADMGNATSLANNQLIYSMYDNAIQKNGIADFVNLQYHMNYSNADSLHHYYNNDVNARAAFYGVDNAETILMSGDIGKSSFNGNIPTLVANNYKIDSAALHLPSFNVLLDTVATNKNSIHIKASLQANEIVNRSLIFNVAVVEKRIVAQDGSELRNVLKKFMYGGDGLFINKNWIRGETMILEERMWVIDRPVYNPDSLALIGFVQDKISGDIYQVAYLDLINKDNTTVTGINDLLVKDAEDIEIYPNPASRMVNFGYNITSGLEYHWSIVDQRGVEIMRGTLNNEVNVHTLDVSSVPNGIYHVIFSHKKEPLTIKKLAVMNIN